MDESISDSSSDDECNLKTKTDFIYSNSLKPKLELNKFDDLQNSQALKSFDGNSNNNSNVASISEYQKALPLGISGSQKWNNNSLKQVIKKEETSEQWRNRLWPPKALTSFCRIITRCKPPQLSSSRDVCKK